ncbi:hypothetical protein [Streptomyces nanshensis]|uniref:Uncharacterized protein n=1 Tax=Streptomyces nanshensis TaxID=518642 RepID=A0A1E7LC57_9ACTN|nr:hypothetical protein [Streptomyces nanshensis]OEV13691.1 hypothetical protein AN218_02325 [Streptomyces nanshensis]
MATDELELIPLRTQSVPAAPGDSGGPAECEDPLMCQSHRGLFGSILRLTLVQGRANARSADRGCGPCW